MSSLQISEICLALKMAPFRWVKYSPFFWGLIWLPLSGPVQSNDLGLIWTQGLMSPSLRWNNPLKGLFWLKLCSSDSRRGRIRLQCPQSWWQSLLFSKWIKFTLSTCKLYNQRNKIIAANVGDEWSVYQWIPGLPFYCVLLSGLSSTTIQCPFESEKII